MSEFHVPIFHLRASKVGSDMHSQSGPVAAPLTNEQGDIPRNDPLGNEQNDFYGTIFAAFAANVPEIDTAGWVCYSEFRTTSTKEEYFMEKWRTAVILVLGVSLVIGGLQTWGWAQTYETQQQTMADLNIFDLLLVRPIAVVGGVVGTGIFILSLPFTIPTDSVDKAADLFISKPFKYAFERRFPDTDM
jgi:hypothetical protein